MSTRKKTEKPCASLSCANKAHDGKFCSTCRTKKMRAVNPIKLVFNRLKQNAKRRKLEFSLSLEHFTEIVSESGYMSLRGRGKHDLTIDRIISPLGYVDGNIQVLPMSENVKKRFRDKEFWQPTRYSSHEEAKRINQTPF